MALTWIQVTPQDFSVDQLYRWLQQNDQDGAIVTFIGKVRNYNQGDGVTGLMLEHYPAMTQKILQIIVGEACERWKISCVSVVHRIGELKPGEQIVFVGVSSAHRADAFAAAEFIMDHLKTRAPFWKRENTHIGGQRWLEANPQDQQAARRW